MRWVEPMKKKTRRLVEELAELLAVSHEVLAEPNEQHRSQFESLVKKHSGRRRAVRDRDLLDAHGQPSHQPGTNHRHPTSTESVLPEYTQRTKMITEDWVMRPNVAPAWRYLGLTATLIAIMLFGGLLFVAFNQSDTSMTAVEVIRPPEEINSTIFQRYIDEAWNAGDLAALDEILTVDHSYHDALQYQESMDVGGLKQVISSFHAGLPDLRVEVQSMTADGDWVWASLTVTGAHSGALELPNEQPISATGNLVTWRASTIIRFEEGKIAETWVLSDPRDLMRQLEPPPDLILAQREDFYPNGIAYDAERGSFLLSSMNEATIFEVDDEGTVTPFIEYDDLEATLGIDDLASIDIYIDAERSRLLVAFGHRIRRCPSCEFQIGLQAHDLATGELIFFSDLTTLNEPGYAHAPAHVTVDDDGNVYVTDWFADMIYKVDLAGNASIFLKHELLRRNPCGIEYSPEGYLLVTTNDPRGDGLFKVPLDDPSEIVQVEVEDGISNPAALTFTPDGELIVLLNYFAGGSVAHVAKLHSDDDWTSASRVADFSNGERGLTNLTLRQDEVYVLDSHLDTGGGADAYEITRVQFEEVEK